VQAVKIINMRKVCVGFKKRSEDDCFCDYSYGFTTLVSASKVKECVCKEGA
jgi:hypothetical protein